MDMETGFFLDVDTRERHSGTRTPGEPGAVAHTPNRAGGGEGRAGRADGAGRTDLRRTQARKRRRSRRRAKTHPGGPGAAAHTPNRARWGGGLGGPAHRAPAAEGNGALLEGRRRIRPEASRTLRRRGCGHLARQAGGLGN